MSLVIDLSFVIPVYNGSASIGPLVERIHETCRGRSFEVVLVNDGSPDDSEAVCRRIAEAHPETVVFVHLARNFGEHSAVLCGLTHARGAYVGILDDDAQHAPDDIVRMRDEAERRGYDVVYGRYAVKQHSWFRNLGSAFNDRLANVMLKKPPDLYLSSFKVLNRFLVDEIIKYQGAFPYIDGLILRSTRNIGQLTVEHHAREQGRSNYTLRKLVALWLNMFLNFSILPLRLAALIGVLTAGVSALLLLVIILDKLWITQNLTVGIPTVLVTIVFFSGVQLFIMGVIGEYLGRMFLDLSRTPQFVVRYVKRGSSP
ncbi:MAG: glycosyltransferase family 2 protein [Pirellulales bacterium]|nr:glycosyltransferase family 2 protein [Pirellulales bacterium]